MHKKTGSTLNDALTKGPPTKRPSDILTQTKYSLRHFVLATLRLEMNGSQNCSFRPQNWCGMQCVTYHNPVILISPKVTSDPMDICPLLL